MVLLKIISLFFFFSCIFESFVLLEIYFCYLVSLICVVLQELFIFEYEKWLDYLFFVLVIVMFVFMGFNLIGQNMNLIMVCIFEMVVVFVMFLVILVIYVIVEQSYSFFLYY